MSNTEKLLTKENSILQNIKNMLNGLYKKLIVSLQQKYNIPAFLIIIGVLFIFLGPCLIGSKVNFTNELEPVTQEPVEIVTQEPNNEVISGILFNTPSIYPEKTYESTSLEHTTPSDFEVLKNFDIVETNNIVSVNEKINDYSKQPTFSPGKFN